MRLNYTSYLPTQDSTFSSSVWLDEETNRIYFVTPQERCLGYEAKSDDDFSDILSKVLNISVNHRGHGLGALYNRDIKGVWEAVVNEDVRDITLMVFTITETDDAAPAAEETEKSVDDRSAPARRTVTVTLVGSIEDDNNALVALVDELSATLATYADYLDLRIEGVNID